MNIGVASYGAIGVNWAQAPLDFQLFNFSGHFRAAETLTVDSMWLPIQKEHTSPIAFSLFIA